MKRILITGKNGYIGGCFIQWMRERGADDRIDTLSVRDDAWKQLSFAGYDVVIHLAAVVHRKEKPDMKALYHRVNTELTCELARKAKQEGVKHFIFMSTKGVYTPNLPLVDRSTPAVPKRLYGFSKLEAEKGILPLRDEGFCVTILRPPTVYGERCPGNFPFLEALSQRVHVFPEVRNRRSMLYIWNLCELLRMVVEEPPEEAILYPQNREYCGTLDILEGLWKARGERYRLLPLTGRLAALLARKLRIRRLMTIFCDAKYDRALSDFRDNGYCVYSFDESMARIARYEQEQHLCPSQSGC